jgi:hypothetical protein
LQLFLAFLQDLLFDDGNRLVDNLVLCSDDIVRDTALVGAKLGIEPDYVATTHLLILATFHMLDPRKLQDTISKVLLYLSLPFNSF